MDHKRLPGLAPHPLRHARQWLHTRGNPLRQLGPGVITGAADDDPGGIATYAQGGAQCGMGLLWTLVLTYPLMSAVQLISAEIGRVTGNGLARNMRQVLPRGMTSLLVLLLFVANVINIGADLAAMGSSAALASGLPAHGLTLGFAVSSLLLQIFVPYHRYARLLRWLTLSLLAYIALLFAVRVDWRDVATGLFVPRAFNRDVLITIVAIFGTTISPYLFFWQSAQEVEEMADRHGEPALLADGRGAAREFARMRFDTFVGMAFSNLIAIAIMIGTAATLHRAGITTIGSAADAAAALRPIAGPFSALLFSLGIIGTGLLAVPVLAGSVAYAVADLRGWPGSLANRLRQGEKFYAVIAAATLLGLGILWSPLDPVRALYWSAVLNGIAAVPLMAAMMLVGSSADLMGTYRVRRTLFLLGWLSTIVMAASVAGMFLFAL